ncbi:MAG: hypothetical protein Kow00121_43330 [Elainellaceae cyanobacterium]
MGAQSPLSSFVLIFVLTQFLLVQLLAAQLWNAACEGFVEFVMVLLPKGTPRGTEELKECP